MIIVRTIFFLLEHKSAALSEMKGAAFLPIPSQGRIGPFEQIIIEVIAYMDMWGEYNDFLLCEVMICKFFSSEI